MTPPTTRPRSRRWRAGVAVLAALSLVAACGDDDERVEGPEGPTDVGALGINELEPTDVEPVDGGVLTVGLPAETTGWNPGANQLADAGVLVASTMLETLLRYDENGELQPHVAESWEHNADFSEWRITLREGVTFHDGTVVTAQHVANSIDFFAHNPASLGAVANDDYIGQPFAEDERTVVVPLPGPWSAFEATLAGGTGWVLAPNMLDPDQGYGSDNPMGTGPFVFKDWTRDQDLEVLRYDGYWGEPAHLEGIKFIVATDPSARASGLQGSDFDMILTSQPRVISQFIGNDDFTIVADFESEQSFVQLNTSIPPFDNLNARKALAYATDRETLIDLLGGGIGVTRTDDPLDGRWAMDDDPGYVEYDPELAEEAVAAYLAETGEDSLSFRLSGLANADESALMQALAEQWDAVGIDVEVSTVEQQVFILEAVGAQYQAQSFRGFAYQDPDAQFFFWHSSTASPPISINFTQFKNPDLDAALEAARVTGDFDERRGHYADAVQVVNENFTHIWLFNTPYALISRAEVRGLNTPRTTAWGNFLPKPWWNEVWMQ